MNDSMIQKFFNALGSDVQRLVDGLRHAELLAFVKEVSESKKAAPTATDVPQPPVADQNLHAEHHTDF